MTYSQKAGASNKLFINTEQSYNNPPNLGYSKTVNQPKNGQQYYTPRNEYQNQQFQMPSTSQPMTARNKPRIFDETLQDTLNRSTNNGYTSTSNKASRSPSPFNQTMPSNIKVFSSKEAQQQKMEASRSKTPTNFAQTQQGFNFNNPQYNQPQFFQSNTSPRNQGNPYDYSNQQGQRIDNYNQGPNFQNERLQNMQYNSGPVQQGYKQPVNQQQPNFYGNGNSGNDADYARESQRPGLNDTRSQLENSMATSKSRRTKPIVVMNINVNPTQKEEIKVYEGDDPTEVAIRFCQKYGLDPKVSKVLEKNIRAHCDKFYQILEEKSRGTSFATSQQTSMKNVDFTQIPSRNSSNREEQDFQSQQQNSFKTFGQAIKNGKQPNFPIDDEDPPYKLRRSLSSKAPKTEKDDDEASDVHKEFQMAKNKVYGKLKTGNWDNNTNTKPVNDKRFSSEDEESSFHPETNPKSAEMIGDRGNVYEYLSKDAEMKQERYHKTQMLKKMHELDGHTFQPQINDSSKRIVEKNPNRAKTPVHQKLYGEALARKNTIESVSTEDKEHTFTPKINKDSKKLAEARSKEDVHNRLYKDKEKMAENLEKKRREQEKTKYVDKKTGQKLFQPTIDRTSTYYKNVGKKPDAAYVEEIVEVDPEEYYDQINQTYDAASHNNSQYDDRSVNKSMNRQVQGKDKSQLYENQGYKQSLAPRNNNPKTNPRDQSPINYSGMNTPRGQNQPQKQQPKPKSSPVDPRSLQGFNLSSIEKELLAEVFKSLDGDGDGRISNNDVDLSAVNPEILDVISDVLVTLDDNVALNFKDFVSMINHEVVLQKLREIHNIPPKSRDEESNPSDYSDNARNNQGYSDDHEDKSTSEISDYNHKEAEKEKEKLKQQIKFFENAARKNDPPLTKHYKQYAKK